MVVVAPTGVAAINAGGVTIHSFFQLPISPFVPNAGTGNSNEGQLDKHSLISRLRFNSERRKLMQELELLIIDEISMVRCDTLDAIDTVLKHIRQQPDEPFGGVQVLFIGDMFQLPPVVPNAEWNILSAFYNSPYFFDSYVMKNEPPIYIEFEKIYRQSDELFIKALNQVRNNQLDREGLEILDSRYLPDFQRGRDSGYIILTTHNAKADDINAIELQKLSGERHFFDAVIDGDFPEKAYPADESLGIKIGAQVMFIKNDMDKARRYFNGKIGTVTEISEEKIFVVCKDEEKAIEVSRYGWKNIRYTLNASSRQVEEEELGSFTQYPLRLAWAITIHKSQGLTFEKAIIDAGEAFAPGQVYVALSRCTNLDGLVLKSKIRAHGLFSDKRIVDFSRTAASSDSLVKELDRSKTRYQQSILREQFNFRPLVMSASTAMEYLKKHGDSFDSNAPGWIQKLLNELQELQDIGGRFLNQLTSIYEQRQPESVRVGQQRIDAAVNYFTSRITEIIASLQQCTISTESKLHAKEINELIRDVFSRLAIKKHLFGSLKKDFVIEKYLIARRNFVVPTFTFNVYSTAVHQEPIGPHPVLYQRLRKERDLICSRKNLPVYRVAGAKTLDELARYLPQSLEEMEKISGLGKATVKSFGQPLLDIVLEYSAENGLSSLMYERPSRKVKKESFNPIGASKEESYRLFREGQSVIDIAQERGLTTQTIEGHLAHFVEQGQIGIEELVSKDKLDMIIAVLKTHENSPLSVLKEQVGNNISFGEIRLAIAWQAYKNTDTA